MQPSSPSNNYHNNYIVKFTVDLIKNKTEFSDVFITSREPIRIKGSDNRITLADAQRIVSDQEISDFIGFLEDEVHPKDRSGTRTKRNINYSIYMGNQNRIRVTILDCGGDNQQTRIIIRNHPPLPEKLDDLGLYGIYHEFNRRRSGLFCFTGPLNQGKTTSMFTLVKEWQSSHSGHVMTIECPIEYPLFSKNALITQLEVGTNKNSKGEPLTFAEGIETCLRSSADIVVIGELLDEASASAAIFAAEAGLKVITTVHTASTAEAVDSILRFFPPDIVEHKRRVLSQVLIGVVNQRLVPPKKSSRRELAFEYIKNTPAIANLIREGKTRQIENDILTTGKESGSAVRSLNQSLLDLYKQGRIDREHALDASYRPEELEKML